MKILVSFIGNSDPIRGGYDGPMLHLVRNYDPNKVFLLLTKRMQNEQRKTFISDSIVHLDKSRNKKTHIEFVNIDSDNPARFDSFGFTAIFDSIQKNHQDDDIIVNITSGTQQMIAALCLEIVTNNRHVKTIQVMNPDPNNRRVEHLNEYEYDFEQNLDNLDEAENRCVETDIFSFKIAQQKQILNTKVSRYDYEGAYETVANSPYINDQDLHALIECAYQSDKLRDNINKTILEKNNICRSRTIARVNDIVHYYQSWKLELYRQDYISTLLRMTPLLYELSKYTILSRIKERMPRYPLWRRLEERDRLKADELDQIHPDLSNRLRLTAPGEVHATSHYLIAILELFMGDQLLGHLQDLREIERDSRNHIAHKIRLSELNMSKLKNQARKSTKLFELVMKELFSGYMNDINLDYFDNLNMLILKKIKEVEE